MDAQEAEASIEISRQRKFGLPVWIERLNFNTNFEQYACSPPENEGFLSECMENKDNGPNVISPSMKQAGVHQNNQKNEVERRAMQTSKSINSITTAYPSRFCDRKQEELFSSPDSTPCGTPEPSPMIRRKLSVPHVDDTIQTNPGRWFYMGKGNNPSSNRSICDTGSKTDSAVRPKKTAIKLVISNFDLNAVSPNSW